MDKNLRKAAFALAAALVVPVSAFAQDVESSTSTDVVDAAVESPSVESSSDVVSESSGSTEAVSDAVTSVESTEAEDSASVASEDVPKEEVNMAQQIQENQDNKAARKEAMRQLSQAYPEGEDSEASRPASEPEVQVASAAAAATAAYIPPTFKTTERMPRFEHHGVFRTRLNYFGNYDLNTFGTSPVGVPISSSDRGTNDQKANVQTDDDAHFGANIRFRYQPTIHITESIRISGTFDVLDNLVLGTTPNGLRENWGANEFFSFNGATPVNGDSMLANALTVKALYGEADTIIGTFRAGRVPTHWGLGIVYNDGGVYKRDQQITEGHGWKCLDCDSSDAVDKVEWRIRDPFFDSLYLQFSWDFVNSGIASYANLQNDSFGQAFDLDESDDVLQFTISVFDRPITQQEIDERYRNMFETRHWVADWGVFYSYRKQDSAPDANSAAIVPNNGAASTYDLYAKKAEAHVFDLWGRFFLPLPKDIMLRLEGEFVGAVGSVELDLNEEGMERDILQFGAAVEAEIWWKDLVAGAKTGVAWADNMKYSGHNLIEKSDEVVMGSIFRFDPSYRVDEIMFHELMGGINNAWYLNVYGEYKFPLELSQTTMSLGARLDLMTAAAIVKDATPGRQAWYGFEADAKVFYEESDRFRFEIGAGVFAPGGAWERVNGSTYPTLPSSTVYSDSEEHEPEVAWNVIANLYFMF